MKDMNTIPLAVMQRPEKVQPGRSFRPAREVVRDGASAYGNNAAWNCRCGFRLPLIATTRPGQTDRTCPKCGAVYRVIGENNGTPVGIEQIEFGSSTGGEWEIKTEAELGLNMDPFAHREDGVETPDP